MNILASAAVLDLWETGLSMTPTSRARLMLEATGEAGETDLSEWTVGRRDEALLQRYCAQSWAREAVVDCPACATTLEITFDPHSLPTGLTAVAINVEVDDYVVTARAPTVGDLATLPTDANAESLGLLLLEQCVVTAAYRGDLVATSDLPGHVVTAIEEALDEADPAADIRVPLTCHECRATWSESLDPVVFVWSAVETAARRLATDVHVLAHAYGWAEREILELSPFRRHLYLSAVGP